jgi:hypothetical protein
MLLKEEYQYYIAHRDELVAQYKGKFLVIMGNEVVGVYDNEIDAYIESVKKYELGTFMLRECLPKDEEHIYSFRSRVRFE